MITNIELMFQVPIYYENYTNSFTLRDRAETLYYFSNPDSLAGLNILPYYFCCCSRMFFLSELFRVCSSHTTVNKRRTIPIIAPREINCLVVFCTPFYNFLHLLLNEWKINDYISYQAFSRQNTQRLE